MKIELSQITVLYSIEEAIKSYRKFAGRNIKQIDKSITVDQAILLFLIHNNPEFTQKAVADILFKDYASITRMIESMIQKKLLLRKPNKTDRRSNDIKLTEKGVETLKELQPVIISNRQQALGGLEKEELEQLDSTLQKIITNCKSE